MAQRRGGVGGDLGVTPPTTETDSDGTDLRVGRFSVIPPIRHAVVAHATIRTLTFGSSGGAAVQPTELLTRVGRLEDDPPIALASVDLTVNNPVPLRRRFEEVFAYIAAVESAVTQNVAEVNALLPDLDTVERRFLTVWSTHELAHAAIFEALRGRLGLDSPGPDGGTSVAPMGIPSTPRRSFRLFGLLANNRWLHEVFRLIYLSRGAMHEHMTYDCYRHLGAQLENLGEHTLASTVAHPIRRQEAAHLGYYRLAAANQRNRMSPAQIRLARQITLHTYLPVGAGQCGKRPAGRVFATLAGEHMDAVLDGVEGVAGELLGDGVRPLPHFVHASMDHCLGRSGQVSVPASGRGRWR